MQAERKVTFALTLNVYICLIPEHNNLNDPFFCYSLLFFDEWIPSTGSGKYTVYYYLIFVRLSIVDVGLYFFWNIGCLALVKLLKEKSNK